MKLGKTIYDGEIRSFYVDGNYAVLFKDEYFSETTNIKLEYGKIKKLPPTQPSKIVAVGLNYRDHIEEMQHEETFEPLLFLKPPSAIIGQGDTIIIPQQSDRVDYEAELGVIISKDCSKVSKEDASSYILGYTCLNDVTARDLQKKDGQWTRGKGFDTFCPIGPVIETELDFNNLTIKSYLNDELRQCSNTKFMIFDVGLLIEYISSIMTLKAGDIIATGTPSGIGKMESGDVVKVAIEHIGELINVVK